jgi:DNA-binding NarL/FixJ family response regulator
LRVTESTWPSDLFLFQTGAQSALDLCPAKWDSTTDTNYSYGELGILNSIRREYPLPEMPDRWLFSGAICQHELSGYPLMEYRHRARLLIADDHTLLAEACKKLLEPEFQVVGIVNNGRELVRLAQELEPDLAIIDIAMPQLNGLDAGEQLKHLLPSCKLVYLTMNMAPDVAAEAFRRGASAYVVKSSAAEELITATRRALRSESYISPLITGETVDFLLRSRQSLTAGKRLTRRQSEILQLLAEGMSMKEIANTLNLKPGTVAFHKYNLMETLGLKSNAGLIQYAMKHNLIT